MTTLRMKPIVRFVGLLVSAVIVAASTAGCTSPEPESATSWAMPEVVWDSGVPSGGAEDSPWAQEFRTLQTMRAYVWATADVSYVEYVSTFGYDAATSDARVIDRSGQLGRELDGDTGLYAEDSPVTNIALQLSVMSVVVAPDEQSAVIDYLYVADRLTPGGQVQFASVRLTHEEDGTVTVLPLPTESPSSDLPEVDTIPVGRWATPIAGPTLPDRVKEPLPREYYVELGVISE